MFSDDILYKYFKIAWLDRTLQGYRKQYRPWPKPGDFYLYKVSEKDKKILKELKSCPNLNPILLKI